MSSIRCIPLLETAAVFAVFFLFGAWKVPDVNEAHYICKAIHFWNPGWLSGDPFLESKDAHWTFYFVFGWLSFFCSPAAMAWIGRFAAWSLLAWSWQRLSYALLPLRWSSILTALTLAFYIEYFNMAGEWLIGGIEGKSLAYPFVFFALESILRNRWNRAGIFLGIASALHILVGGWAAIIAAGVFLRRQITDSRFKTADGRRQTAADASVETESLDNSSATQSPSLLPSAVCRLQTYSAVCRLPSFPRTSFPWLGIAVGTLLALCGLLPGLTLDAGTPSEIVRQAHQIYAFDRLPHHLVPYLMKDTLVFRFALLTLVWILLCRHRGQKHRLFNAFIWGTLALSAAGWITAWAFSGNKELSAEVLRFYWFRLADIAVPMGVAIGAARFLLLGLSKINAIPIPTLGHILSAAAIFIGGYIPVTYICFGYFKLPSDENIPWMLTMLVLMFVLPILCACIYNRNLLAAVLIEKVLVSLSYVILIFVPFSILPDYIDLRVHSNECRSEPKGAFGQRIMPDWLDACQWIEKNTPRESKFWIPRDGHTFKWYAHRGDIGTWKNIPQDAQSVVHWFKAMNELFRYKDLEGVVQTDRLITTLVCSKSEEELAALQNKYGFDYILCVQSYEMPKHIALERVYENDVYCLYRYRKMF